MNGAALPLSLLLGAGALEILARRRWPPDTDQLRLGVRAAVTFAWCLLVCSTHRNWQAGGRVDVSFPPVDGILTATLVFLAALWTWRGAGLQWLAAWILLPMVAFLVAGLEPLLLERARSASSFPRVALQVLGAGGLFAVMTSGRAPGLRSLAHGVVLASMLSLILPLGLLNALEEPVPGVTAARAAGALGLGVVALGLGVAAARALARSGGTPDPWDPPRRLVTTGIYGCLRHPLQLAEVGLALVPAMATGHPWLWCYAVGIAIVLLGPIRALEERGLWRRYGVEAERYRACVPPFAPRFMKGNPEDGSGARRTFFRADA